MGESGSFACPECGNELRLKGTTAGRQLRCGWCETWVEVPFLPRAVIRRARFSKGRRPKWVLWAWAGVAVVALLVAVFGTRGVLKARNRHQVEGNLVALITEAEAEEHAGRFDAAVRAIQEALAQAARLDSPRSARLTELRQLRDKYVRRAAVSQLESAAHAAPGEAIATYKALLARTWREGTLAELEGTLRERLDRTRRQWAEADLAAAKQAVANGQANEAIDFCERLVKTVEELAPAVQSQLQNEATTIVADLIEQRGVIFDAPQGQFTLGTPELYLKALQPILGPVLRQHGYVLDRPASFWAPLWKSKTPYHFALEVVERQFGAYLNTGSQLSSLSLRLMLNGRDGSPIWQVGPLLAQTQPSIPSLSAFTASRYATDSRRRGEFERVLYDDAQATLGARVQASLRGFPKARVSPS